MHLSIQEFVFLLALLPEVLAVTVGAIRYKRLQASMHYLVVLVSVGLVTDIILRILGHHKINNHFVIALYIPVEFWLLSNIYRKELKLRRIQTVVTWTAVGLTLYSLWAGLIRGDPGLSPVGRFLEGIFILGLVLLYFHQTLKHLTIRHLESAPLFWLSAGLFIYFACDVLIFIFSNFILYSYSKLFNYQLWGLHAVLTILLYFFYTLALWIDPKN
ncbi:MAG: hypothetical protein EOO61_19625 [Hymenobacter sp.]|nr:MAG: hypothetical protein EOO61_19625 [Hymenobacter sp.]